jgi:hypothetical protein
LYILKKDSTFFAALYPQPLSSQHQVYFLFGAIHERKILGVFVGKFGHGNFVGVWLNSTRIHLKFEHRDSPKISHYIIPDFYH